MSLFSHLDTTENEIHLKKVDKKLGVVYIINLYALLDCMICAISGHLDRKAFPKLQDYSVLLNKINDLRQSHTALNSLVSVDSGEPYMAWMVMFVQTTMPMCVTKLQYFGLQWYMSYYKDAGDQETPGQERDGPCLLFNVTWT